MVEILQRLAVGFKIVIDENIWFRRQAALGHQVKLEPQISKRAKGLEEHQPALSLEVTADEEDLDRIGVRNAWRWPTPFLHVHTGGNNCDLVGRHFIILYKAEFGPF